MRIIYLLLLLCLAPLVQADEWTPADTKREAAYLTLDAIDWLQTRQIAKHPDKWAETNRALGEHPSVNRVDAYFALTALAHVAVAYCLPAGYREVFQYVSIGFEGAMVANNVSIGIRL